MAARTHLHTSHKDLIMDSSVSEADIAIIPEENTRPTSDVAEATSDETHPDASLAPGTSTDLTLERIEQPGIITGLAKTLAVSETTLVAITRTKENELLVSIQPSLGKESLAGSTLPLQVIGSPSEIDAQLLDALADYVPARELVRATAAQIAADTAAAAALAKTEAAKKRANAASTTPATKAIKEHTLLVTVEPENAKLVVTTVANGGGHAVAVEPNKRTKVAAGSYGIRVSADGYDTYDQTIQIEKDEKVSVVLKRPALSLLGAL